ncbi:hypothetical protein KC329_g14214 [Hortaea werneckii]|nr:hypothetical protein KC329_g14214 [Hortaea werneckii]
MDLTTTKAYKSGQIILQDKASCFPAYLLNPGSTEGDVIDACAAPGNKTTHLAAILAEKDNQDAKVIACEKNELRSQTLTKMTKLAGGEKSITVKAKQDFMRLDPSAKEYRNVTALLLDPSCSGSGITTTESPRHHHQEARNANAKPTNPRLSNNHLLHLYSRHQQSRNKKNSP